MTLRPLPRPIRLLETRPAWSYPAPRAATRYGHAHLTLWAALHAGDVPGFLAVVTETGHGLSITNGMEHLWMELHGRWAKFTQPLTLIEHYPPTEGAAHEEHLDEAWVEPGGHPAWRRIWPTTPVNPDHDLLTAWSDEHVPHLLDAARTAATQ